MHISFDVRWQVGQVNPEEIDPDLFRLLEAVRAGGSLSSAAQSVAVSYRHAWGLLRRWETRFHLPLVQLRRGRGNGAHLSEFGDRLLRARAQVRDQVGQELSRFGEQLGREIADLGRDGSRRIVRLAASHGMAIAQLVDALKSDAALNVQLQTRGSIESLKLLARGECSMAGFHFPAEKITGLLAPIYQPWLRRDRVTLLLVAVREQGLLTRPANPKGIFTIADLARPRVRFVNRQPDSGTRTIFDGLLREAGVDARRINGYDREEFTHLAVAAMVASDAADAAFGIRAAAAEFNLRFVSILREGYYIALPRESAELRTAVQSVLQSQSFRNRIRGLPGYDAAHAGRELDPGEMLRAH